MTREEVLNVAPFLIALTIVCGALALVLPWSYVLTGYLSACFAYTVGHWDGEDTQLERDVRDWFAGPKWHTGDTGDTGGRDD